MSDIRVELIRDLGPARQHGRTRYAPRHSPGRQRGTGGVRRPPGRTRGCRAPDPQGGHGAGTLRHGSPTAAPLPRVCRREAAAPRRDRASTAGVREPRFGAKEGLRVLLHGPGWRPRPVHAPPDRAHLCTLPICSPA